MPLIMMMALVAFGLAIVKPSGLELLEMKTLDFRFQSRGIIPADPRVAIIAVDDDSLSEEGRWPWSRDKIALLVDKALGQYGAKALGFDMVFSEEQANQVDEATRVLRSASLNDPYADGHINWLQKHSALGDVDAILERTLNKYKDRLVPGYFFYPEGADTPALVKSQLAEEAELIRSLAMTSTFSKEAMHSIPHIAAIEGNLARFTKTVDAIGFFNFFPDTDGTVRRIPLMTELEGYVYPSMAMQTLRMFLDWPDMAVVVGDVGVEEVRLGPLSMQTDEHGSMLLNHYGPGRTFKHISAADILNDRLEGDELRDKVVIFGVTAIGVYDYRPTPFDSVFPGVEGHAVAISNILNGEELHRPPSVEVLELLAVLFLSLLAGYLVYGRSPLSQGISIIGFPLIVVGVSQWLFTDHHIWVAETYLIIGVLLTTVPTTLFGYIIESRKRAFIHDAFSHYLAPSVVENLAKNPDALKLGGEEKHITAFFSDIASFSTFSEQLSPSELVAFLNRYLTAMSDIVLEEMGTIDKYEGDAIIAFFGAPLDLEDHAERCVMAALKQQEALAVLREEWKAEGLPEVHIRIGLNSGPMVVGNMGTESSMNYTMMGDHVNLAARLEGVCKAYRVPILMSKDTYMLVRGRVSARFVDRVRVVGRSQPVDLYQPMATRTDISDEARKESRTYEQAWSLMSEGNFDESLQILAKLYASNPNDGLYEVMMQRVKGYVQTPPADGWGGVFNLKNK
ncbi:MAG: adenylate/guanylate cyclase domain-containing protein [Ghiorsea sp.]